MRIEHTIDIAATPERVWELTLDIESWPRYTPTMDSVERLDSGPLAVGARARIKQPGQRAKVWTVAQLDDEKAFAWGTRAFGMTMTGGHYLTATVDGTTQTLAIELDGPMAPLLGPLLKRPILSAITKENEGFKSAAEAS